MCVYKYTMMTCARPLHMHSNNKIAFYNTVAQCSVVVIMAKTHDINQKKKNKMPPEKRDLITLDDYYLKKKKRITPHKI